MYISDARHSAPTTLSKVVRRGGPIYECVGCWAGYYADRRVRQRRRAGGGEIRSEDEDIIITPQEHVEGGKVMAWSVFGTQTIIGMGISLAFRGVKSSIF